LYQRWRFFRLASPNDFGRRSLAKVIKSAVAFIKAIMVIRKERNDDLDDRVFAGSIRDYNPRDVCSGVAAAPADARSVGCLKLRAHVAMHRCRPTALNRRQACLPAMASLIPHLSGPRGSIGRDIIIGQLLYLR